MKSKIRTGIVGGAGYAGGEIIRLLLNHPNVNITFIHSRSHAGSYIFNVHTDLIGDTKQKFTSSLSNDIDVLFLCLGHGDSQKFLSENKVDKHIRIIDLSQDFRINKTFNDREFIYGLPELNKSSIKTAFNVANPGCFATCIQLALLPLASNRLLAAEVHISATTGSTGAGQTTATTTQFSWRNNNVSVYKAFQHQHVKEVEQSVKFLQPEFDKTINFIPSRGNFTRGIAASLYVKCDLSLENIKKVYDMYYINAPFIHISDTNTDLKQVINTNKCILYLEKHNDKLMVLSNIDNLLKGASGQAVQNMNIMYGIEETTGLKLKAVAF